MGWTDERVDRLKRLWLEGQSASQIAKDLGGVTRNAVIGKVHRLGLSGRATPSQPSRPTFKAARPARPAASAPRRPLELVRPQPAAVAAAEPATVEPEAVVHPEAPGSATVLTLGAHMCKWPIGDPAKDTFTFCGRRASDERPYCAEHARLAYQAAPMRKKTGPTELARSLRRYI